MSTPEDYVASAVVANAIAWIAIFSLVKDPYLLILLYTIGAVLAGFLMARKAGGEVFWKVGLKSGMGAFVLHIFLFTAIELLIGGSILTLWDHVTVLSVLLLGGVVGAFLFFFTTRGEAEKKG